MIDRARLDRIRFNLSHYSHIIVEYIDRIHYNRVILHVFRKREPSVPIFHSILRIPLDSLPPKRSRAANSLSSSPDPISTMNASNEKALAAKKQREPGNCIERAEPLITLIASGSIKQCPLRAFLASQSLHEERDAKLRKSQDEPECWDELNMPQREVRGRLSHANRSGGCCIHAS